VISCNVCYVALPAIRTYKLDAAFWATRSYSRHHLLRVSVSRVLTAKVLSMGNGIFDLPHK